MYYFTRTLRVNLPTCWINRLYCRRLPSLWANHQRLSVCQSSRLKWLWSEHRSLSGRYSDRDILNRRDDTKVVKEGAANICASLLSFTPTKTSSTSWPRILSTTGESNVHAAIRKIPKKLNAHKKTRSLFPSSHKFPLWHMTRIKENAHQKRFKQGFNSPSGKSTTRTSSERPKLHTSSKVVLPEPKASTKKATVWLSRPSRSSRMRMRRLQPGTISNSSSSTSSSGRMTRNTTFSSWPIPHPWWITQCWLKPPKKPSIKTCTPRRNQELQMRSTSWSSFSVIWASPSPRLGWTMSRLR